MPTRTLRTRFVFPELPRKIQRRNVAAYARVSTGSREQENSLEAQKGFYEEFIRSHEVWNYAGLYVDNGISGLCTHNRDGFNRLIEDAILGKIDLVITKSISRFARNTVDTLTAIRKLKAKGVEVYFEKEDIYTFDAKGEFILALMSSFAQEESRSISENVKWGKRKAFSDGKYSVAYSTFLGYNKGQDSPLKINENEAKTVRLIYLLFLEGRTAYYIAKLLTELFIPTPGGKHLWTPAVVESILANEKYKGDALLQKKYTVDFLIKKAVRNEGQLPQYYVRNGHPAIIPRDIHEYVEALRDSHRKQSGKSYSGHEALSGKIVCQCGLTYGKRYANHKGKYPHTRWVCKSKDKSIEHSPAVKDSVLLSIIRLTLIELVEFKKEMITQSIHLVCCSIPEKETEIKALAKFITTEDFSQLLFNDNTLRILIRKISIDERRNIMVEFINGFQSFFINNKK